MSVLHSFSPATVCTPSIVALFNITKADSAYNAEWNQMKTAVILTNHISIKQVCRTSNNKPLFDHESSTSDLSLTLFHFNSFFRVSSITIQTSLSLSLSPSPYLSQPLPQKLAVYQIQINVPFCKYATHTHHWK